MSCLGFCSGPSRSEKKLSPQVMAFDAASILKEVRIFHDVSEAKINELKDCLEERPYAAGASLMRYGDIGSEFFIIVSGKCEVLNEDNIKVAELNDGDYCGEQALLQESPRNATIRAILPTTTLVCTKENFDSIIAESVYFVKREAKRKAVLTNITEDPGFNSPQPSEKTPEQRQWLFEMVEDNVMFMHLSEEQRYLVIDQMYEEQIPANFDLISQGDTNAQTFYVVQDGTFNVYINNELVTTVNQGGCFGELALMYKAPRAATCRAMTECVVWTVQRNAFRRALANFSRARLAKNLEFLETVEMLRPLLKDELVLVDEAMDQNTYGANSCIIQQGDPPNKFYIIQDGVCRWEKDNGNGNVESGDLNVGEFFGELALLNDDVRAASVFAATDCTLLEMGREHFKDLLGPLDELLKRHSEVYTPKDNSNDEVTDDGDIHHVGACPLEELRTVGILGKGAFGLVSLVTDPRSDKAYALKAIKKAQIVELGQQSHIVNEKRVMELMNHDFLVNLRGTYKDAYRVYFLLDVCLGGELFTILRKRRYFNEPTSKFYAACVVEAFDYMHSKRIIYRDLKPENLVLDDRGFLKVTDFGFAKVVADKTFTLCGTPDYLAPEIVTGQGHGKGVDWWTLGILIYEMLASFPPFYDDVPVETYRKIIKCRIKFPRYFTQEAKELIKSLLRSKPTKRLGVLKGGAKNIRAHPWFADFDWDGLVNFALEPPIIPTVSSYDDISNFDSMDDEDDQDLVAVSAEEDFDDEF